MKKQLLIGTNNPGKKKHWEEHLRVYELLSPEMLGITEIPEEGIESLTENAKYKAKFYMERSGIMSFSTDVGFYIPDLNNLPGVATRRWAGKLPENVSDEEWMEYFYKEISSLQKDIIPARLTWANALADISGIVNVVTHDIWGVIDKAYFKSADLDKGYPIGSVFIPDGFGKIWSNLDEEERKRRDEGLVNKFKSLL